MWGGVPHTCKLTALSCFIRVCICISRKVENIDRARLMHFLEYDFLELRGEKQHEDDDHDMSTCSITCAFQIADLRGYILVVGLQV
jgi:hypothetical protein